MNIKFTNCYSSDGQVVSVQKNDSGSIPIRDTDCKVFSAMQGHWTAAFYDAITWPTEYINFIVNSVKIVNMPHTLIVNIPYLEGGKQSQYYTNWKLFRVSW